MLSRMSHSAPVMVGVSGGVDSSVAALLLARAGRSVAGLFMKNWEEDDAHGTCPAERDVADARAVCDALGIALHTRNFAAEYWDGVFERFLAEHRAGRTPNPDVLCNREIKFKTFLEHARDLGAERIATGHYARVAHEQGCYRLLKGRDPAKDQSYFLHTLGQAQLAVTEFPIGDMPKAEVRALARAEGLPTHAKKDSTGICFIGERDFAGFLGRYLAPQPGPILDVSGRELGRHQGVMFYTLGQRGGLGIGGRRDGSGEPWYVVGKDPAQAVVRVDQGAHSPHLLATRLTASELTWTTGAPPAGRFACHAKIRYRQTDQACQVDIAEDGSARVCFAEPQRAVTPGQSVVFYAGEECLGGGVIEASNATWGGLDVTD
jgi:tRNA-specific 2-thiouridylase